MLKLNLDAVAERGLKVLCLGAHCDDIEIGCGGTILQLVEAYGSALEVYWVVFSSTETRAKEATQGADRFLAGARIRSIDIKPFRTSFFPYSGAEIKEYFEYLKQDFTPDLIFTHYRHDAHQDHRIISDLTWNTFRDHLILEYEIPKYEGDSGNPNVFYPLSASTCQRKIAIIMEVFATQKHRSWFTEETFSSLLRIRGVQSNSPSQFSEAFYCRKALLYPA